MSAVASVMEFWSGLPDYLRSTFWILVVTIALILSVAFSTLWERKVIGWMQLRKGPNRVERNALLRNDEASTTRDFVDHVANGRPTLVVGDLNMPTSSHIYRTHWGAFINAHEAAGHGYGYTSPCSRFWWWPLETPWLRIDHILTSPHWAVSRCNRGESAGSDHRLVGARLHLTGATRP